MSFNSDMFGQRDFQIPDSFMPGSMKVPPVSDPVQYSSSLKEPPSYDSIFVDKIPNFDSGDSKFSFESPSPNLFQNSQSVSNVVKESSDLGSNIVGVGLSEVNSGLMNTMNEKDLSSAHMGTGENGVAFDANYHAEQNASNVSLATNVGNAGLAIGSSFGVPGLIAGATLAAGLDVASASGAFDSNENTTMSTGGNLVNDADY